MSSKSAIKSFFVPRFDLKFLVRLTVVAVVAYIFFGYVCIPTRIKGQSMVPTYPSRGINFCWTPAYWFATPQVGDVVIIRAAGKNVLFLKRVVATEGDTVAFRKGTLYVNGEPQQEDYVKYKAQNWNLPERKVKDDYVYVVGDRRDTPMHNHLFGQTHKKRVIGAPLW